MARISVNLDIGPDRLLCSVIVIGSRRSRLFATAHVKKGDRGRGMAIAAANGGPVSPEFL